MSKILRRPMFRGGGKVSSYGTGISAPLVSGYAYGGNINTPGGIVDLPGGYAETPMERILKQFGNASVGTSGGVMPERTYKIGADLMAMNNVPPSMRYQEEDKEDQTSFETMIENNQFDDQDITKKTDKVTLEDKIESYTPNPNEKLIELLSQDSTFVDDNNVERSRTTGKIVENKKPGEEIDTSGNDLPPSMRGTDQPYESPTMTMKQAEMNQGNVMPGVEVNEGEVVIGGAGEDSGIEAMADEYFKLMGGEKARGRDISDMLLRFAGSKGNTVGEKFQNYAAEESKVKSRTEGLQEKATGFAIQQDAQMKMLQKKLDSSESIAEQNLIAAEMRALNKQYSPSITQKDINYGKSLKKGSEDHTMYLRKNKLAPTLESEIKSNVQIGTAMGVGEINALGPIYYDNWQGIFKEGVSEDDGRYLDVANQEIVYFQGGKEISKTKITLTQ